MSTLSETIVFLWLLPVLLNIILPLSVLTIWPVLRLLGLARSITPIENEAATRHAY
ncbi:hypothetical protein [Desulfopila aestuarii]|uniref:Uncharacterized protein n=1 Tax=Desulfopila aestuarii DSM 18488 TaxID=1121416 RepID=A0A1M7Y4L1_9BACT|nr:hypothetical protein [Desulfopila aestuarii]SHO47248.1 hypothetical protein SAMN02745220_01799 [Desulfopila aestuarii DSM 18488]